MSEWGLAHQKPVRMTARISVKLVSEAGVGTIAAGVAKAGSQVILISGHDGGTGAAPISSIHHAGLPWELGLSEAHQTLIQNGLRGRVIIETDGKLMSGRDVAIACLLGAEEFGFATAPLITMGCAMMRVCNLDTCPFGVATQNEKLRARFPGKPEYVENFMKFIAQELREYMALLGFHSVDEMCGRSDLLKMKEKQGFRRAGLLDLSRVLASTDDAGEWKKTRDTFDFKLDKGADLTTLVPKFLGATYSKTSEKRQSIEPSSQIKIQSTDRTFGTIFGSEVQKKFGGKLEDDAFVISVKGGAGQSFGAFVPKGVTLRLEGEANDYFGKGLSGGKLVVKKDSEFEGKADENIIIGNVALFGSTSGKAFINGVAGERFCVRNSGVTAVVEGCGDHGLEYMTGGQAVILGSTGRNFAAGMSGGVAYVLDEKHDLYKRLNHALVKSYDLCDSATTLKNVTDEENLHSLIEQHAAETGSEKAKSILADWEYYRTCFKKIIPNDYLRVMTEIYAEEESGVSYDDAVLNAFKKVTA